MASVESEVYELGALDQLSRGNTSVHRIDPRVKVVVTLVYLVCVVSFHRYDVLGLIPFVFFPVVLASAADLPMRLLGKRLLQAAPFAVMVGAFNPWFDQAVLGQVGSLTITGGWVSYLSIILRFLLTTSAALVLIATTSMNDVCLAIQRMGVPDVLANQLLFLYRYIFVLAEEVLRLGRARSLRSFDGKGMGWRVYSQILGSLLLRTLARATRIYEAMLSRGFTGTLHTMHHLKLRRSDLFFAAGWCVAFLLFRFYNVLLLVGGLVTRVIS
jgi:cobalt/nickel transport system permease protein